MSLIQSMMEACTLLNHIREDDGYGGTKEYWSDGATFQAAVIKNSSTEAQIAQQQGVNELFTIVIQKGFQLDYHDVFRRQSDGQTFRVTSNVADSEAPDASTVRIAKVTAERWVIPA